MCWTSANKPILKTAEEDISVKKVLMDGMTSPFFYMKWKKNKVQESNRPLNPFEISTRFGWCIEEGLHSCKEIYRLIIPKVTMLTDLQKDCKINPDYNYRYYSSQPNVDASHFVMGLNYAECHVFDAVIPKGAKYCLNEYGEYASDKLIVKDITKDPIKKIKL